MRLSLLLLVGCAWLSPEDPSITYTVVRGDSLSKIARAHDVTVDDLRAWNGIDGDFIEVGQQIVIRTGAAPEQVQPTKPAAPSAKRRRSAGSSASAGGAQPPSAPSLSMPAPKPCLDPPDVDGDRGISASQGLDPADIRRAVDGFLPNVIPCVQEAPTGRMQLSFLVGCDGRVTSVAPSHDPGWPAEVTACVTRTMRHIPFPAHGLPDGDRFTVPLQFD